MSSEDPYGLPTRIKKEEESSEEDPEGLPHGQPSELFQEAREHAPHAPESTQPQRVAEWLHNPELTLGTVMNEVTTVKDERSRLRTNVENVSAQVNALKAAWSHMAADVTTRQSGKANRLSQIEGHLNLLASD